MASIVRTSRKKTDFDIKVEGRGNYWENYCKSITAANDSSQWMHVAHLQSTQIIAYNINISHPSNSSFNTLECHQNTTSHVTTHLSEAFAVDFRKHFLPKNNDAHSHWQQSRPLPLPLLLAQRWLAEEQPQQQADERFIREEMFFTSGTQKVI